MSTQCGPLQNDLMSNACRVAVLLEDFGDWQVGTMSRRVCPLKKGEVVLYLIESDEVDRKGNPKRVLALKASKVPFVDVNTTPEKLHSELLTMIKEIGIPISFNSLNND